MDTILSDKATKVRAINRLSARAVTTLGPGKHNDGAGLWLHKRPDGGGQWVLRVTIHGRRREMGLGSALEVSLKEAREAAEKWRAMVRSNIDPIKERERQKREAAHNLHLLKDVAVDAFESRKAELKDDGDAGRWFSPLEHHILPKLGKVPVADIDQKDTHLAMRLLILTGVRSGPLRSIHESQIDGNVWTIPGEAMKGRKDATNDFRVPLTVEAMKVIDIARRHARDGFLFPNVRSGVISDMTLGMFMRRAKLEARPHGFRSSLRDWIAETTDTPHDIAETVLGHTVGGTVERAYRRTDFLEQRRNLMERWSKHITGAGAELLTIARAV